MEQPAGLTAVEGALVQVNCTYGTSGFNGLSWYQQRAGGAPVFLSYIVLDELQTRGRFSTFLSRSDRHSHLLLRKLRVTDSASYLCAVSDTVAAGPLHLHRNPSSPRSQGCFLLCIRIAEGGWS